MVSNVFTFMMDEFVQTTRILGQRKIIVDECISHPSIKISERLKAISHSNTLFSLAMKQGLRN